jgi:hypothetical protein
MLGHGEGVYVMDEAQNTADEQQEQPKTFTQDEVNRIVAERLKRHKPDDYEALKEKAAKLDELEEANKSELEKAQAAYQSAQKELDELKARAAISETRSRVAAETGIPAELITGDTEDSMRAQAEAIAAYTESKTSSYPADKGGAATGNAAMTEDEIRKIKNPAERVRLRAQLNAQRR